MRLVAVADMGHSGGRCRTLVDYQASACSEMVFEERDTGQVRASAQEHLNPRRSIVTGAVIDWRPEEHSNQMIHDYHLEEGVPLQRLAGSMCCGRPPATSAGMMERGGPPSMFDASVSPIYYCLQTVSYLPARSHFDDDIAMAGVTVPQAEGRSSSYLRMCV